MITSDLFTNNSPALFENTGPVTHRIGLTVTDPNHPMVSKRKEPYQKSIRITQNVPDREAAINQAIAHYRRKGYKVHDHHYLGTVDQGMAEGSFKQTPGQQQYGALHSQLQSLANSGQINTPDGKQKAEKMIDTIQQLVDTDPSCAGSTVPSKKIWLSEQGMAEGGIATVGWPDDEDSHTNNRPPVNVGGTFDARPVVKRGSLVKASGLTGVYRVMDILRDEAKIVQEIPRTGVSTYVPMSDLRVWTNKPIREQGMAETNNDTGVKWFDFATWVLKQGDKYKGFTTNHTVHQAAQKAYKAYVNSQKQGMAEASLGDYRKKATVNKAMAQTNRFFDRDDPAKVAAADQTIAKREKGLARADARIKSYTPPPAAPADLEKQQRDLTAKYPNIDELVRRAELNRDPNYEMADGQAYYAARDAEQNYQKLRQIQRVIQGLNESLNRSHLP
jgi:hypothetical protein